MARRLALVVVGLFIAFPGRWAWQDKHRMDVVRKANAIFQERCKKSGVFIHRTAENVEGVFLLKIRSPEKNYGDQYKMDDPYGRDLSGEGYIESFIRGKFQATHTGVMRPGYPEYLGFHYVDPKDGKRYRYTGGIKEVTRTYSLSMGGDGKTGNPRPILRRVMA
jgi:hypothetical protein